MDYSLSSIDLTSDFTTVSEVTEVTEVNSDAKDWIGLREKLEPVLIVARKTTPFRTGKSE